MTLCFSNDFEYSVYRFIVDILSHATSILKRARLVGNEDFKAKTGVRRSCDLCDTTISHLNSVFARVGGHLSNITTGLTVQRRPRNQEPEDTVESEDAMSSEHHVMTKEDEDFERKVCCGVTMNDKWPKNDPQVFLVPVPDDGISSFTLLRPLARGSVIRRVSTHFFLCFF